jgi:hypothetical protein
MLDTTVHWVSPPPGIFTVLTTLFRAICRPRCNSGDISFVRILCRYLIDHLTSALLADLKIAIDVSIACKEGLDGVKLGVGDVT